MRIALYKDEYGAISKLRYFPCVEIDLDSMTNNTDYVIEFTSNEYTIQGVSFRVRQLYVKNAGISKVTGISENPNDLLMQKPFWTWNDDTSQRMWMGGHFTAQSFESQPDDWDNALYYKYYNYTADSSWIQYRSPVSTTFDAGTTYYTCDSEEYEPQKIYYGKTKYAPSFVIGQMLGSSSSPNIAGGIMNGYCCGVGLGASATVSRYRTFAMKGADEEYNGYATMHNTDILPIQLNSLNHWTLVSNPERNITLPFTWQMAHIIYQGNNYIGWGAIRWGGYEEYPEGAYLANFTFVPIMLFEDAIVPDEPPYSAGTPAGNTGGQGGYGSGLPDGDNFGADVSGGNLTPLGYGVNAYIIDNSDIGTLSDFLWGRSGNAFDAGGLWDKFKNYKFNPIAGILSLHHLPYELLPNAGASVPVRLAGLTFDGLSTGVPSISGLGIAGENHIKEYDIPTVYLDHEHGNLPYFSFEDFARTRVKVYLPYCGTVELDPASCIGGSIEIKYQCDCINGNVGVQIVTTTIPPKNGNPARRHISAVASGNAAYQIPITGNDNGTGEILGALKQAAMGAVGLAGGNIGGILSPALTLAFGTEKHTTTVSGSIAGNAGYLTSRSVIVEITYGDYYKTDENYPAEMMRPAASSGIVSDFVGHSQLIAHADSITLATDSERLEIETALKNGVLI